MQQASAEQIWEDIYRAASPRSSGKPGDALQRFAQSLPAGHALELGCARGDDAVWLARKGWKVLAVDISPTVLGYAAANARHAGVDDRITFEQHDLSRSFPGGRFALVTASFLQSPAEFPRATVLHRAAEAVIPSGYLFIAEHGSRAPWSWSPPDTRYPAVEDTLASLELNESDWARIIVSASERQATGPTGQTAMVVDNVIVLKRV